MRLHRGIRIHSIPVAGAGGLIVAVGMTVLILMAVPALRPLAALCLGGVAAPLCSGRFASECRLARA